MERRDHRPDISIDAASVSDPVLIRADGQVLYTFASSVDDVEMGVTHIVRGADHVTNTATQIQIMQAMGGTPPAFAHHSLLTGAQGEELSKRLGTLSLRDLRARGVEPMALLSLMARLGSSKPVELASSLDELAAGFDIESFGAAPTEIRCRGSVPADPRHRAGPALRRGARSASRRLACPRMRPSGSGPWPAATSPCWTRCRRSNRPGKLSGARDRSCNEDSGEWRAAPAEGITISGAPPCGQGQRGHRAAGELP
jgi:hypothetical protein